MLRKFLFKLSLFLLTGAVLLTGWAWFWGFFGVMTPSRTDFILHCLLPWQRKELADALNYYYDNNIISRHTIGYVLRCDSTVDSIKRQFNWFHRNAASATFKTMPSYHEVVYDALATQIKKKNIPANASTFQLETMLELAVADHGKKLLTRKDLIGMGIGTFSLGLRILAVAVNPWIGGALMGISIVQSSLSDSVKAIPGILTFMEIRGRNMSYCFLTSWFLCLILFFRPRLKAKASAKSVKPGKKKKTSAKSAKPKKPKPAKKKKSKKKK